MSRRSHLFGSAERLRKKPAHNITANWAGTWLRSRGCNWWTLSWLNTSDVVARCNLNINLFMMSSCVSYYDEVEVDSATGCFGSPVWSLCWNDFLTLRTGVHSRIWSENSPHYKRSFYNGSWLQYFIPCYTIAFIFGNSWRLMPGFHHSVAVLPLPFRRSAVVNFRCSVKNYVRKFRSVAAVKGKKLP